MKYRIKQVNYRFYPQQLILGFFWVGFNRNLYKKYENVHFLSLDDARNVYFLSLDDARKFLNTTSLEKTPIIKIHPYP